MGASLQETASVARAAYRVINAVLLACARFLWPGARPATAARVCVFRIGNLGDIACALPAITAIRRAYPSAHLTLLTSPGAAGMPSALDVLEDVDWIDELWLYHSEDIDTFGKRIALLRELRAQRFDVWIDLPSTLTPISRQFRDMAFAWLAGAKWARGWRIDTLRWGLQAQSEWLRFPNEVGRTLAIIRESGFDDGRIDFGFPRADEIAGRIDTILRFRGLHAERLVAIAPGAKRSTNRWETERFVEVGRQLQERGCRVVLLGDRNEASLCRSIAQEIGRPAQSFAGDLSVCESNEILRRCELAVCVDSGIQHLAAAVGTPCLSLFSFQDVRGKWHPHGPHHVVLQKWVDCHTCLLERCPNGNRCMKAIEADEVVSHAVRMLDLAGGKTHQARAPLP